MDLKLISISVLSTAKNLCIFNYKYLHDLIG